MTPARVRVRQFSSLLLAAQWSVGFGGLSTALPPQIPRNEWMRRLVAQGMSPTAVAREYNISPQRVWQIVNGTCRRNGPSPPFRVGHIGCAQHLLAQSSV